MKKSILRNCFLTFLAFTQLFSCNEKQVDRPAAVTPLPKENSASLLPSLIVEKPTQTKTTPKVSTFEYHEKVEALVNTPENNIKKIPFQELMKANIAFTQNKGQLERFEHFSYPELGKVNFYSKVFCGTAFFGTKGIAFDFQRGGLRDADFNVNNTPKEKMAKVVRKEIIGFSIEFQNANENPAVYGIGEQHTKLNYLKGNDPNLFIKDVPNYEKIKYESLYKGIDLVYYNKSNQLKYDYIVAPKAEVAQIRMNYKNVSGLTINKKGELEIAVSWGVLVDKKPYSYQIINGKKKEVNITYAKIDDNTIGFAVNGTYNKNKELIIDPFTVAWATYIGMATSDDGYIESTCIDNSGRVLGTGWTNNAFPVGASPNGYDKTYNNGSDAYVFRLNGAGTTMDYVSFIGGDGNEVGTGIAVNSAGNICVTGHTTSFAQTTFRENSTTTLTVGTGNIIVNVAAIGVYGNPQNIMLVNGTNVMYGTIYGFPNGTSLNVNVTNTVGSGTFGTWQIFLVNSAPFPSTIGSIQPAKTGADGNEDIFYLILNGSGNNLLYGTHYGGSGGSLVDWAIDLTLDASDNAYIVGRTQTTTGFATAGVYKTVAQGGYDGYILKINSNGTLGYCSYIGGTGNDIAKGVVVTSSGEVLITGMTGSNGQGTVGAFSTTLSGSDDAFLLKLSSTGTMGAGCFFSYIGGTSLDSGAGIELAGTNNEAIIVGTTASSDFPRVNPIDNVYTAEEGFVARFTVNGAALRYSSFIGGDGSDNIKGFDYTTVHKNGGIKVSNGMPIIVLGMNSSAASLSSFLISPITYTAINQSGVNYSYNAGAPSGGALGDFFLTVLDSTGQTGLFGSYFGGADNDYPTAGINIQQSTACVIFGGGVHSLPFPVTPGAFQTQRVNSTTPDQAAIVKVCLPEILPVDLLSFTVKANNGTALLNWSTASEKNNDYFVVLKSFDGIHFTAIGKVNGAGNSSDITHYSFVDPVLSPGTTYYKLQQVNFDGQFKFTSIRNLTIKALDNYFISPNPGNGMLTFTGVLNTDALIEIRIQNVIQQIVFESKIEASKGTVEKEISLQNEANGMYIIEIIVGNERKTVKYIKE